MVNMKDSDKAIKWPKTGIHLQNPASKGHMKAHPCWPTGKHQWLQWCVDDRYKIADLFKNTDKILAQ